MKEKGYFYRIGCIVLAILVLILPWIPEEAQAAGFAHGTVNYLVTEDMVNNVPDKDYKIHTDVQAEAQEGLYNAYFLKEEIQTVEITIDEKNLNYLLQNALQEPYVLAESVTIGDTTLGYVGLKTKGSYTLDHSFRDNPGSDRFSFTINFGKFIKKAGYGAKQNFYGCNKISFNNFFFDKTMMKEYCALKLMTEMGLPTPQYGLAKLYINGAYYGVYAMVEAMDESILQQYLDVEKKELSSYLVKPEGTNFLESSLAENQSPLWENDEDTKKDVEDMLPTVVEWVKKLNKLHTGKDFEGKKIDVNSQEYIDLLNEICDVDEMLRYFATHSWLCQMDNMFDGQKNFGLYVDENGRSMLIPWDYDLSFGCFYPSSSEATANLSLDVMWRNWDNRTSAQAFYKNYPLFYVFYQNESLREQYHQYMKECSQIAVLGGTLASTGKTYEPGRFTAAIETLREKIYEAASEKLAGNVYYMNGISQPADVKSGLNHLEKIITMRAIGVYTQVEGIKTTVSGAGCNLGALGNGIAADSTRNGNVTMTDAMTGIFVTAEYPKTNRQEISLALKNIGNQDTAFRRFISASGYEEGNVTLYRLSSKAKGDGSYQITIPLAWIDGEVDGRYKICTWDGDGDSKELEISMNGNLATVEVEELGYLAVVRGEGQNSVSVADHLDWTSYFPIPGLPLIAGILLVTGIAIAVFRMKKQK